METKTPQKHEAPFTAKRIARYILPLIVLGLAVHLILPQVTSLKHSYQVMKSLALWAVGLAIVAQIASYLGSGYLLKALVRVSGNSLSILSGTIITLAGASFGMVAGGMVGSSAAIYNWLQKDNMHTEAATLAGTIPGLLNNIVLMLVSLVGLVHLLVVHQLSNLQGISFVLILIILTSLICLLAWGLRNREALTLLVDRSGRRLARLRHKDYQPEKTANWLAGLFAAVDLLISEGWRGPLLGAVLNIIFDMLTLYFLFIAAAHRISPGMLLTGYGLPLLLGKMAFMIPGGVGVVESAMIGLYTGLGIPYSVAVVVVLTYRILSFWLPLVIGFPLIFILQNKGKLVFN